MPLSMRLQPLVKEKRSRQDTAWIIHDIKSGTMLITQKLQHAADFANTHLAQAKHERVSIQSLYEAADTRGNRVDGYHKMRYNITRCRLDTAHQEFDRARNQPGVREAIIVTDSPWCYTVVPSDSFAEE